MEIHQLWQPVCLCILWSQKSAWCVTQEEFYCKASPSSLFRHPCFADRIICLATAERSRALECESQLGWARVQVRFKRDLSQEGLAMFLKAIHSQPLWSLIRGSGCFIYNDFSCRMAPVCYSCIEYAQIILVHGAIGGIAKLHLMTEWQPSVLRASNVILWRIFFFSCLWSWKKQSGGEMISWVCLLCF